MNMKNNKIKLFNIKLDSITAENFLLEIDRLFTKKTASLIATVNIEFINQAINDSEFFKILCEHSSLNTIDGAGVIWAYKTLNSWKPHSFLKYIYVPLHWLFSLIFFPITYQYYKKTIHKLSGSDIVWDICKYAAKEKKRVFLLGYKLGLDPNVVQKTSLKLQTDIADLSISGVLSSTESQSNEKHIIDVIKKSGSDILLCGFGSPKQEFWLKKNLSKTGCKIGIGLGGTFDFIAGVQKRAPRFMQIIGLEWFYRLLQNPKRIRRQSAIAKIAWLVLINRIK